MSPELSAHERSIVLRRFMDLVDQHIIVRQAALRRGSITLGQYQWEMALLRSLMIAGLHSRVHGQRLFDLVSGSMQVVW